ncbi:hypothetical protein P691DRAFT_783541 [Macrolepiota fuliginosa MF-IS2]|uniref:Uncharacterized protein n=1 Tax=Macrolepiota fuliginosa MF-IS2 TaxID=1400762 RepID=A0A9P5X8G9_9AGAR|nr:hypothetical protein P691DRAFT_783541 [Macrolepiota fuliginosa MF-IS2]
MPLEPGLYIISCRGAGGYIGKNLVEDKSLLPKRIVNVPPDAGAPQFTVERSPSSTECYVIRTTGALIAERNQLLWAYVLDSFAPSTYLWCINAEPQHGEHAYTQELTGLVFSVSRSLVGLLVGVSHAAQQRLKSLLNL